MLTQNRQLERTYWRSTRARTPDLEMPGGLQPGLHGAPGLAQGAGGLDPAGALLHSTSSWLGKALAMTKLNFLC